MADTIYALIADDPMLQLRNRRLQSDEFASSSRRAVRMARAAGEPDWRQTSRVKADMTPAASHTGPNSHAAAARAK